MFLIDLHFGQEHATVVGGDTEDMIIVVQNCTCNLIKKDQQSLSFLCNAIRFLLQLGF